MHRWRIRGHKSNFTHCIFFSTMWPQRGSARKWERNLHRNILFKKLVQSIYLDCKHCHLVIQLCFPAQSSSYKHVTSQHFTLQMYMLFVLLYSLIVKLRETCIMWIFSFVLCYVSVKLAGQATQTLHVCEVSTSLLWFTVVLFVIMLPDVLKYCGPNLAYTHTPCRNAASLLLVNH